MADVDRPTLADAPPVTEIPELKVHHKTTTTLSAFVVGPQGIQLEVRIEGVVFDGLEGAATRAIAFENALIQKGLVPVPQQEPVVVQAGASQAAAAPAAWAVELPPVTPGGPPICSLHGAMVQRQGNNGAFWSCSNKVNGAWCRPKKAGS